MTQCYSTKTAQRQNTATNEDAGGNKDGRSSMETTIARIWASVLGLEGVDIHENFLLLGGESLLATQVAAEVLSEVGVEVPIRSILVGTVAEVAEEVAAKLGSAA